MASGSKLLDASGRKMLDGAGHRVVSNGAGDDCCCTSCSVVNCVTLTIADLAYTSGVLPSNLLPTSWAGKYTAEIYGTDPNADYCVRLNPSGVATFFDLELPLRMKITSVGTGDVLVDESFHVFFFYTYATGGGLYFNVSPFIYYAGEGVLGINYRLFDAVGSPFATDPRPFQICWNSDFVFTNAAASQGRSWGNSGTLDWKIQDTSPGAGYSFENTIYVGSSGTLTISKTACECVSNCRYVWEAAAACGDESWVVSLASKTCLTTGVGDTDWSLYSVTTTDGVTTYVQRKTTYGGSCVVDGDCPDVSPPAPPGFPPLPCNCKCVSLLVNQWSTRAVDDPDFPAGWQTTSILKSFCIDAAATSVTFSGSGAPFFGKTITIGDGWVCVGPDPTVPGLCVYAKLVDFAVLCDCLDKGEGDDSECAPVDPDPAEFDTPADPSSGDVAACGCDGGCPDDIHLCCNDYLIAFSDGVLGGSFSNLYEKEAGTPIFWDTADQFGMSITCVDGVWTLTASSDTGGTHTESWTFTGPCPPTDPADWTKASGTVLVITGITPTGCP